MESQHQNTQIYRILNDQLKNNEQKTEECLWKNADL